jgi:hypothetical protein
MDTNQKLLHFDEGAFATDEAAPTVGARCPLHTLVGQIAQTALQQHVLFLEGECLPRVEAIRDLESLTTLVKLVSGRVCVCSRELPLRDDELGRLLATLSDPGLRAVAATCARARVCPLGQ